MTRRALLLGLAILGSACGLKTAPVAPELVVPTPPTSVHASPTATGIELAWRRPTRYSGGGRMRDIERFVIERSDESRPTWTEVGTVVMTDRYRLQQPRRIDWLDTEVAPGTRYAYRVVTVTRDGQHSVPSTPVALRHRVVAPDENAHADDDPS